jgi:mannosyltransferase OCH1-like enzyme
MNIIIILILLLLFLIVIYFFSKHYYYKIPKIPKVIHQTFSNIINLPYEIKLIMNENKKKCPECIFKFYSDEDCELFIKNNFNKDVYNAYKKINPIYGAMKADFFRYCVLYKEGGIYLDIKSNFLDDPFKYIKEDDICILDIKRNNLESWRFYNPTYEQWLLIFQKGHPYLSKMINQMIYYINIKFEPQIKGFDNLNTKQKILHITGPDAFTKVIESEKKILHRNIDYYTIAAIYTTDYKKMYRMNNRKHYSEYDEPLYIN